MQLVEQSGLQYELRPETLEDLWILSQFVGSSDLISATDERKVKVGSENNPKQVKKLIHIDLLVSKVSFENNILRVSGEIQNETEFTAVGSSHTLSFSIHDRIKLEKKQVLNYQEKLLKQALDSKKTLNLLVLMDKDDLIAAEFGDFSYQVLFEQSGLGSKKYTGEEVNEDEQKYKLLEPLLKRDYQHVILAGPGFFKENLKKFLENKLGLKILLHTSQQVDPSFVQQTIKEIHSTGLIESSQLGLENEKVQELLLRMQKQEKAAYGEEAVINVVNEGRVDFLLLTTKFVNTKRENDEYESLNEVMKTVEQLKGELVIVQSDHEPGKVLEGIGGIGALLRY